MAIALSLCGFFLWMDQGYTPVAVVACVIVYNAAFGFSWVRPHFPACGRPSKHCRLLTGFRPSGPDPVALPRRDPPERVPRQGRLALDGFELVQQLCRRRDDPDKPGSARLEDVPDARRFLRHEFLARLFRVSRECVMLPSLWREISPADDDFDRSLQLAVCRSRRWVGISPAFTSQTPS